MVKDEMAKPNTLNHRRRIYTEEKTKVVAALLGDVYRTSHIATRTIWGKKFWKNIHFGRVLVWCGCELKDHPCFRSIRSAKCPFFYSSISSNCLFFCKDPSSMRRILKTSDNERIDLSITKKRSIWSKNRWSNSPPCSLYQLPDNSGRIFTCEMIRENNIGILFRDLR